MERNEKEKQSLYDWGIQNRVEHYFQKIDKAVNSYFVERKTEYEEKGYIKEYGFETLPEFTRELDALWKDDGVFEEIKKVIGIAAIKNKPSEDLIQKAESKEKAGNQLRSYIYNF